jgi:homoserine O-acetyltransferase
VSTTSAARPAATITHELAGTDGAPVILALGGISATRHVAGHPGDDSPGWWEGIAGRRRALDLESRRVLGVDFLDGGRAAGGRPATIVTTHHQAAAIVDLLDGLGVEQLDALVGASYGGMVGLALAQRWPTRVRRLVVISAAHQPHPMATALRSLQRQVVELGLDTGRGSDAMVLARGIAMTTYRTAREFADRFGADWRGDGPRHDAEFEVERYLRRSGERFAERMRPERFLALSLSADLHCIEPEQVRVPTTLIAAQGDTLVPPAQMRQLGRRLRNLAGFFTLRTRRGHDAFLTETGQLGRILATILAH